MASIRCPRCNVIVEIRPAIVDGKVVDLDRSRPTQTVTAIARYEVEALWQDNTRPGYTIANCGNCKGRFVIEHREQGDGHYYGAKVVWPLPNVQVESEIPKPIREALEDSRKAHSVGAEIAALLAARTALIRMQREQEVTSLKGLVEAGKLTNVLYRQADEVRQWANIQGHDDMPPGAIEAADVEELLEYLEVVLRTLYLDPIRLKKRQERRDGIKT